MSRDKMWREIIWLRGFLAVAFAWETLDRIVSHQDIVGACIAGFIAVVSCALVISGIQVMRLERLLLRAASEPADTPPEGM